MEPEPDPVAAGASSSPPPSQAPATSSLFPDHKIAATEPHPVAAGTSSSPPPSPAPATSPPSSPAPATPPIFPDHQIEPVEPHQVAAGASSSPPSTSHHFSDHQIAPMEPHPVAVGASSSPPPSPAPAASPPSSPAPAASPPRQTRDDDERGAVECTDAEGDVNSAPPAPQQQQATVEDDVLGSYVEQEQPNKESMEGAGEALRAFMEKFGDQQEDSIILSPWLREISTHDNPAALHFLGEKYNNLMERYRKQLVKCSEECEPRYNGMKKKYTDECAERRRLYNEIIELKGNIRVFCRCRPLSSDEVTRGCLPVVEIDPSHENELQFVPTEKERKPFKFDHVFGPEDDQEAVFSETVPVVRSVMDGFNVCIFAYGQTGTGKTFTMEGVPENRGVNYRALEELFKISEQRSDSIAYTFSVSILEVYNEKIKDLLDESNDQSKRLDIKQNADGIQEVYGLVEAPVYNIDGVWEKLKFGAQNRSIGSTNANELSSRSHGLVRVTVRSEHLITCQKSRSQMWLVDLAGSERIAKTGAEGDRLKESQFINKSLSALGDVISALASKNSHIPYRNSKLTHLLQSSLGGDCKTLMFVQISPSSMDSGETLSSLNFASRVRSVEHGPVRKQVDPTETLKFKQMSEKLLHEEKENVQLNQKLQMMQLKYTSRENVLRSLNEKVRDAEQACRNYQQRIRELETELGNEKRASWDSARSSRPPLVPPRQRQPQGRNKSNIPVPPSGPSRWRPKASIHNKENIPVVMNKSNPVDETNKFVSRARRVSLTPVIRQIPIQPKRRSSMATLPSVREPEHLSVINEKRAGSRLSKVHWPRRSVASFGLNLVPGTPIGGHDGPVDATPDAAKFRRFDFESSSSKFTSPPNVGMAPAGGPANTAKLCFSVQKRVKASIHNKENIPVAMNKSNPVDDPSKVVSRARRVSLTPVIRQIPIQPKRRSSMAILPSVREPEHLSVINEKRAGSRLSQVHWPRRSVASFGVNLVAGTPIGGPVDATPDAAKFRRFDFESSSSKFTSPPNVGMAPAGGPANAPKLCFSIQKRVTPPRVRAQPPLGQGQPALGILDPTLRANMVVGRTGMLLNPAPRRVLNPKRRQSVI